MTKTKHYKPAMIRSFLIGMIISITPTYLITAKVHQWPYIAPDTVVVLELHRGMPIETEFKTIVNMMEIK